MPVVGWIKGVFEGKSQEAEHRRFFKEIDDQLVFAKSDHLSLGVEFELGLLNAETLAPVPMGSVLVSELTSPSIKEELFLHMIEVTSEIGLSVQEVERQIRASIERVLDACKKKGLLLSGTARPPSVRLADLVLYQTERFRRLAEERRIFVDRFSSLGMHVHLGMRNAAACVCYNNFFLHFLPHLLALSASSPFEEGSLSGMAAMRPSVAESMPIAGTPYAFKNWREYRGLCHALYKAGSIQKLKDLWWDQRPSPLFGTLEIRVCDQPATLAEGMALVAFIHLLALWFDKNQSWFDDMPRPNLWRQRENKWRAMRYGLEAQLVVNDQGETKSLCDDIHEWLERVRPFVESFGYQPYVQTLESMMMRGNSSVRQRRLWAVTHNLDDITRFNCMEFEVMLPQWDRLEAFVGAGDGRSVSAFFS